MQVAKQILENVIAKYKSETAYLDAVAGAVIASEAIVADMVGEWLHKHHLQDTVKLMFSETMVAPASMSYDTISIAAAPLRIREETLASTLNHEVAYTSEPDSDPSINSKPGS